MDFTENPGFGSGGLPGAISSAAEASFVEKLHTYQNPLPHVVIGLVRFRIVRWGGAGSVDFDENIGFGSGGWPRTVSMAAEAAVFENLRTYQIPHPMRSLIF